MSYNIVTNYSINQLIKSKSKYYSINLGLASTAIDYRGERTFNTNDNFANYYNNLYRTTIYGQGNIGNIRFYTDHYIKEDKLAFYYNEEEFIFDLDKEMINEKGSDFFIGHMIKKIDEEYQERVKEKERVKEEEKKKIGDSDKVLTNPGNVSYADLKEFLEKQRIERLKI